MSKKTKYEQIEQGKWYDWNTTQDLACCHCHMVHEVSVRIRKGRKQLKFTINGSATGGLRKHHEIGES